MKYILPLGFQFYLQDTKSSNGTFINNQRLCKGGEESSPREVFSGDHIQFGVNVMENNRRGEQSKYTCTGDSPRFPTTRSPKADL